MLPLKPESALARIRRIYGKPALLSASFAYGAYVLVQIDQFHGSIARTALNVAAGVVPCALAGCLLAFVLAPLMSIVTTNAFGARALVAKTLGASAVLGIVAALVIMLDRLGRAG